jgi:hypothetical protein
MPQNWTSFTLSIAVKSNLATIYKAWSTAVEIEKWFLESCHYSHTEPHQQVEASNSYFWSWYLYAPKEQGKIMQANGKDFFQFTFAGDCLLHIQLKEVGEHVMVTLTQNNIPTDEQSKFNISIGCLQGWTFYLTNLKSFYETGYDLRNKNPELRGLNN